MGIHHANEENLYADISREKEILDATGFEEMRIAVYDENINDRDLKDINDVEQLKTCTTG